MQHILPSGFSKIRYFGFLSLRNLQENIQQCCNILEEVIFLPELDGLNGYEVFREVMNVDPLQCQRCKKGRMVVKKTIKAPS